MTRYNTTKKQKLGFTPFSEKARDWHF